MFGNSITAHAVVFYSSQILNMSIQQCWHACNRSSNAPLSVQNADSRPPNERYIYFYLLWGHIRTEPVPKRKEIWTHQMALSPMLVSEEFQDPKIKAKNFGQSQDRQLEKHGQDRQDEEYGLCHKLNPSMLSSSPFCVAGPLVDTICPSPVVVLWQLVVRWSTPHPPNLPLFLLLSVTVNKRTIPPVPLSHRLCCEAN